MILLLIARNDHCSIKYVMTNICVNMSLTHWGLMCNGQICHQTTWVNYLLTSDIFIGILFLCVSYVKWLPRSPGCITSFGTTPLLVSLAII